MEEVAATTDNCRDGAVLPERRPKTLSFLTLSLFLLSGTRGAKTTRVVNLLSFVYCHPYCVGFSSTLPFMQIIV